MSVLICVQGPTGIGKTRVAIALAKHYQSEVVSCDSRQFFKEMSIGTAVPSPEELKIVPHHFIQHLSIHDKYTVGNYEKDALNLLRHAFKKHHKMVLVGGSNLYRDALVNGLDHFPKVPDKVIQKLQQDLEIQGIESLQKQLKALDPDYFKLVDLQNPHRLIRALGVCLASGKPFSSFHNQPKTPRPFKTFTIGLSMERSKLYDRINQRVEKMIDQGLVEEAKALHPWAALNSLQTVGYKELFDYFDQKCSLEYAIEEIKKNSRRYAKRQLTWLRKQPEVFWVDANTPVDQIINKISV